MIILKTWNLNLGFWPLKILQNSFSPNFTCKWNFSASLSNYFSAWIFPTLISPFPALMLLSSFSWVALLHWISALSLSLSFSLPLPPSHSVTDYSGFSRVCDISLGAGLLVLKSGQSRDNWSVDILPHIYKIYTLYIYINNIYIFTSIQIGTKRVFQDVAKSSEPNT